MASDATQSTNMKSITKKTGLGESTASNLASLGTKSTIGPMHSPMKGGNNLIRVSNNDNSARQIDVLQETIDSPS